jgi:transposase-like protein
VAKQKVGRYPLEFRRMVVERMRNSKNIYELSKELGVNRSLMYHWRGQLETTPAGETPERDEALEDPRDAKLREENAVLKRALAEKGLEVDFFKAALQKVAARRQQSKGSGERASTTKSGK